MTNIKLSLSVVIEFSNLATAFLAQNYYLISLPAPSFRTNRESFFFEEIMHFYYIQYLVNDAHSFMQEPI